MQADISVQTPAQFHLASVETGKAWFNALPAADPKAAMDAVNLALSALLATDYAGAGAANTLQVLETLRKLMATLSGDLSVRYAGKSLPLSATQRAAFDANITFAWTLAYVYYSLIEASQEAHRASGHWGVPTMVL